MKITPMIQGNGAQNLANIEVGRTADPIKMERARAIARGEIVSEVTQPVADKPQVSLKSIKMQTNQSTNRDEGATLEPESTIAEKVEPAVVEATQPLSPQFAALARQKRALQLERAEIDKLKAEAQAAGTKPADELIAKLKSNPLSVLQEHGVTYDQLTEAVLANPLNPEIQALKEEIRALKEGVDNTFKTKEQQNEEAALAEMRREAVNLAKEGDSFALVRETHSIPHVMELIRRTYKETGEVLDVSEAMNLVESELIKDAERMAAIEKVKSKILPSPPPLQPQQTQPQMRTLTARDTANPIMSRRARAIAAMQGTLKR